MVTDRQVRLLFDELTSGKTLGKAAASEILGLEVDEVSFKLDKVFIWPNQWRRLKTATSERAVPLWPQLKEILSEYLMERDRYGHPHDRVRSPVVEYRVEKYRTELKDRLEAFAPTSA